MAVITPPWAIQGQSHPAATFRRYLEGGPGQGVSGVFGSAGALKVTERAGTPTTGIDVAEGFAILKGGFGTYQGSYVFESQGVVQLAVAAGHATLARKDLVVARVYDNAEDGSGQSKAALEVITGTASGSPVDPTLPAGSTYITLARIDVPANDTSITNSQITDLRPAHPLWTNGRGYVAGATNSTTQSGIGAGPTVLTGTSVTFTAVAGRRYRVTGHGQARIQTALARYTISVDEGGTDLGRIASDDVAAIGDRYVFKGWVNRPDPGATANAFSAGSHTVRLSATRATGTGTLDVEGATAGAPTTVLVEDLGGYLI